MDSIEPLFQQIQEQLPAVTAWLYISMWAFAEMSLRMKQHPDQPNFHEILFPHTSVPLFTEEEARNLEEAWRESEGGFEQIWEVFADMNTMDVQTGGGGFPPTLQDAAKVSKALGKVAGIAVAGVNPEAFSVNYYYQILKNILDSLDSQVTDLSKQFGLVAMESIVPDPKFVIPVGPVPIPIVIPVRTILPIVNTVLELLRVATTIFPMTSFLGKPVTLLMVLLDLGRGNLYHAIFSFLGMFGKYPMYAGILLKIVRDAYMLIAPDIRSELREVLFKSSKSFFTGFMIWFFAVISPEIIRKPIVMLLDKVRLIAENWNDIMAKAEVKATAALKGVGYVELPKLPSDKIPSIGDLYILQEYIHHPRFYCHPDVSPLLQQMRSIPPLALFFDLLNIPASTSMEYQTQCAEVETVPLEKALAPRIVYTSPDGQVLPDMPLPSGPDVIPKVSI